MQIHTDKRLFKRIEGKLAVRYSPQGSNMEFCTSSKDISGAGIRMVLLKRISPRSFVDLEIFKYTTDIKVRCRGKVIWVWNESIDKDTEGHIEAGIQFIDRPFLYIAKLINYLESHREASTTSYDQ